jgi:recombinational DNA repair protein RecR
MEDILTLIACCLVPFITALFLIVKTIKEHHETQQVLNNMYSKTKELGGNGFISNQMDLIHSLDECRDKMSKLEHQHKSPKLTNCKNCGAVLHSNKCEFCGTEYDW